MVCLLALPAYSAADIYKYVDENGVICYTDSAMATNTTTVFKEQKALTRPLMPQNSNSNLYGSYVKKAAMKYQVEPELIKAVIKTESNWNKWAVSKKGAMGLMQLMPSTARVLDVSNPFDAEENIDGGTKYLRLLLEKFNGDLRLALAAYNAGPKRVEEYGTVPPYAETQDYVRKVFALYDGKRNFSFASYASSGGPENAPERIYKVELEDGTILFTNMPIASNKRLRF